MTRRSLLVMALLAVPGRAAATYSVVATDRATQQVGGAVTSCVGSTSVAAVFGSAPGHGGINAQASANAAGRTEGVRLLNMDVAPDQIIAAITASSFDTRAATRQYGIADLSGRAAGFTGTSAMNYKEHRPGTIDTYTYSIQGNILTGKAVIDQTEAAFRTQGCDLADKLMLALEAGGENGQGDTRCTGSKQIPSDSASIQVDPAGMPVGSYLRLSVAGTGTRNPLTLLRTMFNTWRTTHACATGTTPDAGTPVDAGAGTGGAAGRAGTGGAAGRAGTGGAGGRGGSGGRGTGGAVPADAAVGDGGPATGGTVGTGGFVGTGGAAAAQGGRPGTGGADVPTDGGGTGAAGAGNGGCGCGVGRGDTASLLGFLALGLLLVVFGREGRPSGAKGRRRRLQVDVGVD